jgi:protoporphyrinogen oxidase
MNEKVAVIIGAGPAGLTAAYELIERTHFKPVIYEMSDDVGGISRTVNVNGNRMDIGGHRFFSKSDRVMRWWLRVLPLQGPPAGNDPNPPPSALFNTSPDAPDPERDDRVMLVRRRVSRIYFLRKLFDYPISLSARTVMNLGLARTAEIILSYLRARAFPIKPERSLEDFLVNRFGRELYRTFFKDYTEKVWGFPCDGIAPEWGAQRVKGLSIGRAVLQAASSLFSTEASLDQKKRETSLIEHFLYPKFGPGQMWQEVARIIRDRGGRIELMHRVTGLKVGGDRVLEATIRNEITGVEKVRKGDLFFSTMPVKELIQAMGDEVPEDVRRIAEGLVYRDFIAVGLLLKRLRIEERSGRKRTGRHNVQDNWIYIQERDVKLGRIQIFNNWSPYLVKDPDTVWIGLEYFCNEGDALWSMSDGALLEYAVDELVRLRMIVREDFLDGTVVRMLKTYPAYLGTYDRFHVIKDYVDRYRNLFLIGRNGMHKYNNQDHSMLAAMTAVDNIVDNRPDKENIWAVNAEDAYHEERQ